MEIKVKCRKEGGSWIIDDPGEVFVAENRIVWSFQGLEPGVVPLLAFKDDQPFGPFSRARLTASTITVELEELPATPVIHDYELVLVQWNPDRPGLLVTLPHHVTIVPPETVEIKVSWPDRAHEPIVGRDPCEVGGARLVQWRIELPDDVFATIDFGSSSPAGEEEPRPMGPFAELHGRYENGAYLVTGQTDLRRAVYQYAISLYERETYRPLFRHDPQIDNNGDPPGVGGRQESAG